MELRGSAGELLRSAVTPYIQNLSESHFPCHDDKIVDLWKMIIGKNIHFLLTWKYLLCGYILDVLTLLSALDRFWGGFYSSLFHRVKELLYLYMYLFFLQKQKLPS